MKKINQSLVIALSTVALQLPVLAINIVPSKKNLRFNDDSNAVTFTVTLNDNISGLSGSGNLNATLKLNSKLFAADTTTVSIPYTDGVIGVSTPVTVTLLNSDVTKTATSPFSIKFSAADAKRYKLKPYKGKFNLDAEPIAVSGKVTIPEADASSFQARTLKKLAKLKAKSIAPLNTDNPEGVLVELVPINTATGEVSGEAVATALTDSKGNFEMDMPASAEFGTGYAIMVEGDAGEAMHAPLFGTEVDVNPATEVLFDLSQEAVADPTAIGLAAGADFDLSNFTDAEAEGLDEKFHDLNPLFEETLSDSVQSLRDTYANFLNNMLGAAADDDLTGAATDIGDAAEGVAGIYNVSFFNVTVSSETSLRMSVELAAARMSKPDEVGAFAVTPFPSFSTQASLEELRSWGGPQDGGQQGPDGGQQGPQGGSQQPQGGGSGDPSQTPTATRVRPNNSGDCYDVTAYSEGARQVNGTQDGNFYMTVNNEGVINFAQPAEEQSGSTPEGDTFTFRVKPSVMNMFPVGEGMYLSTQYSEMENSNSGGTRTEYDVGFASIIKRSNLSEGEVDGDYGLVGVGYTLGTTSYGTTSFTGELSISGTNANFTVTSADRNIENVGCGGSFALSSNETTEAGTAVLNIVNDRLDIQVEADAGTESVFTGFARPDAKVLSLIYAQDNGARGSRTDFGGESRNVISDADRQVILAVKKPTSTPDLNGKTYRLLSMSFSFNAEGGRTITTSEVGTLSFAGSTATVAGVTQNVFSKSDSDSDLVATTADISSSSAATIGADGAISFTLGTEAASGYIASDKSLIVLGTNSDSGLGIYFAVEQ